VTNLEKAKIILENMEKHLQINWNLEEFYLRGIIKGLLEIEKGDKDEKDIPFNNNHRHDFNTNSTQDSNCRERI